jgi:transposase-like protein
MILSGLNVTLSHMSIWRDAQQAGAEINKRNAWGSVRVLGVDGAYVLGWGDTRGVLVAVDLGTGQPVCIGWVDERNPQAVRHWLEPLVQRLGVGVIVTDDLSSYRKVAEQLNLGHQVCQFHVRRWVGKALRDFEHSIPPDWQWLVAEVQGLIDDLPPDGDKRLYELWKDLAVPRSAGQALTPLQQLRDLLLRLSEHWQSYCAFYREPEVPWTNNTTEQAIGRMKMRARTVRGYKSWQGMQTGLLLAGTRP